MSTLNMPNGQTVTEEIVLDELSEPAVLTQNMLARMDVRDSSAIASENTVGVAVSTQQTLLDQVITGIPWQDGFAFGSGVDAITGGVAGSALKPFTPASNKTKTSHEFYRFIESDRELNLEIGASASGKYNIQGVTINASTEFLTKIKYSETVITLVAEYASASGYSDKNMSYELTDQAKQLINDPNKFRQVYGDYFVADAQQGSRFMAVYVCQATSAENLVEFKASLGAEVPEVFSAQGSTRFMRSASQYNISVSSYLYMDGYTGTPPSSPWNPQKILEALDWFKAHEQGQNLNAELKHYSAIAPNYPRTIPVAPQVFVDLRLLYTQLWDIRARYDSIPTYYQNQFKREYTTLDYGIVANQANLAEDANKRRDYQHQADNLKSELDDVYSRMDFYFHVKEYLETNPEPAQDLKIKETKGTNTWMYGFDRYPKSSAVVIHSTRLNYKKGYRIGHRNHTFEFGPDSRYLIVGWEVLSNRKDGLNGSWWKSVDRILLSDRATVQVESRADRGFDWSLVVYYVDVKDYQF